ncbi:GDPGTP exchange factor Sec2p [Penicillium verhagenii]|uniref:GDPGTP exchange factor Sec2p n=1 Tax=Penicillium verhagenii TaxID=1562060 RepID=UPI0025458778|nr:GDPGTP exchange factor Sec2p [Penicillium verhagenii]KAJ5947248.1 GDPGTP exchange factor Sec2p [Penicillium verhagenii]
MSATTTTIATATLVGIPSTMKTVATATENHCATCGSTKTDSFDSSEAQLRIQELEGQIQDLTHRVALDANKLADYEDEITRLRKSQTHTHTRGSYDTPRSSASLPPSSSHTDKSTLSPTQIPATPDTASQPTTYHSRLATLTSLLPYRRGSSTPTTASAPTPTAALPTTPTSIPPNPLPQSSPASSDNAELQDALTREQGLRKAAESQLSLASNELEELTVQLFSQANEMVAQERKARAKLEERVAVLERRDIEKRGRLEKLEKSIARVDRLKALVNS